ncbi:MAG: protein tyrosine phosphatase [Proteobacteria bacterium]|nr:MAG: protein tyrosine phosphatase [Pseudomonadota bacterium]
MRYTVGLLITLTFISLNAYAFDARLRPSNWGTPIISEHLDNWYQVDKHVYRSEQPDDEAMLEIENFGIQYVLNLREYHDDIDETQNTHLTLLHIPIRTSNISDEHVIKALRFIRKSDKPILVHCWHGADRTGTIIAMYRIIEQGWSKQAAIDELIHGGYHYHAIFDNIVTYIQSADIKNIKRKLE